MNKGGSTSPFDESRVKFEKIVIENNLGNSDVSITVKTLSPEEAIGTPGRRDFPIVTGKERVVEAKFHEAKAHAFTDSPKEFIGKLEEVIAIPLVTNGGRAIFIATMNAVLKHLNIIETTLHCKDEEPEKCAEEIAAYTKETFGPEIVGLVGLNPAILEALSAVFGSKNVRVTDLNRQNVWTIRYGVNVWDGNTMTERLVREAHVVLLTGTTLVNGTFDGIWETIRQYKKNYLIYGVTSAGICELTGLKRICPYGRG
ncbi:MAG: DUF364 domain-containing protein [Proteobacteria bacterium]|nr:DUF364 domain-containing protein [Pseudomonadota bacterium]